MSSTRRPSTAPPNIERSVRKKKNTSLDASSEGASDGPTKVTSKEAKLHGLWQCPLQCVFGVSSFRGFSLDASQTRQYFGAYLFNAPLSTPRGKSIIPSRLSPFRNTHILPNSSLPLNPIKHKKADLLFDIANGYGQLLSV